MTLIIGHATKEIGFLIADTLLSSSVPLRGDEGSFNCVSHTLKIHILSGRPAVSFAGAPGLTYDLIAELKTETEAN